MLLYVASDCSVVQVNQWLGSLINLIKFSTIGLRSLHKGEWRLQNTLGNILGSVSLALQEGAQSVETAESVRKQIHGKN